MKITKLGRHFEYRGHAVIKLWPWVRKGRGKYYRVSTHEFIKTKKELKRTLSSPIQAGYALEGWALIALGVTALSPDVPYNVVLLNYNEADLRRHLPTYSLGFIRPPVYEYGGRGLTYILPCTNYFALWSLVRVLRDMETENSDSKYLVIDSDSKNITDEVIRKLL